MATRPTLPTRLKSPAETMPMATHRKTSGATAVLIRRRKMSPRILSSTATEGSRKPKAAPRTIAATIWKPRPRQRGFLAFAGGGGGVSLMLDMVSLRAFLGAPFRGKAEPAPGAWG